jgi:hypothetical protein
MKRKESPAVTSYIFNSPIYLKQANRLLLRYLQDWGHTKKEKLETLEEIAHWLGFKSVITDGIGFQISDKEDNNFLKFWNEIDNIKRGSVNSEILQLVKILKKYKAINRKWYEFWR